MYLHIVSAVPPSLKAHYIRFQRENFCHVYKIFYYQVYSFVPNENDTKSYKLPFPGNNVNVNDIANKI